MHPMNKLCSILLTSGVLDHTFAWHHSYLAPSLTFFRDDKIEFRLLTHVSTACVYLASLQLPDKSIYQIERETEAEKRRVWKHMITYCPIADLDVFFFFSLFQHSITKWQIYLFTSSHKTAQGMSSKRRREKNRVRLSNFLSLTCIFRRLCRRLHAHNVGLYLGAGESLLRQQNLCFGTQSGE